MRQYMRDLKELEWLRRQDIFKHTDDDLLQANILWTSKSRAEFFSHFFLLTPLCH